MTQRNYLQHGNRHRSTGTDPIPGLSLGWISGYQSGITVPSQSTPATQIDLTSATVNTNDTTSFSIVASNGLTINQPGFYVAVVYGIFGAAGTVGTPAEIVWNLSGLGDQIHGQAPFLTGISGTNALVHATQGFPVDPSSVGTAAPLALKQVSLAAATVAIEFTVFRVTDDYGDF